MKHLTIPTYYPEYTARCRIGWVGGNEVPKLTKEMKLAQLAARIEQHADWWLFPSEELVRGFFGTDPLFIVGDQPSTSAWPPTNPNRRAFYDLLTRLGAENAHLTDLYKRRGRSSALRSGIPSDFAEHVGIFREELAAVEPARVVALGDLAFELLIVHVPEIVPRLTYMWHFGYARRYGRIREWEEMARQAVSAPLAVAPKPGSRAGRTSSPTARRSLEHFSPSPVKASEYAVIYEFSRLRFKAEIIEPLLPDQAFCVVTPVGTFAMTKREFHEHFRNVVASESYRLRKIYHYPELPKKALPFKVC